MSYRARCGNHSAGRRRLEVFVASDSSRAVAECQAWARSDFVRRELQLNVRTPPKATLTQNFTKLLAGQRSVGSLWSSSSGGDGAGTKRLNPRDQERADHLQNVMATEIVVDLVILSEATTLVGLCMSQVSSHDSARFHAARRKRPFLSRFRCFTIDRCFLLLHQKVPLFFSFFF